MSAFPTPKLKSKRSIAAERMTMKEVNDFMLKHGFSDKEFSELLGVTLQAVRLWTSGEREFTVTNSRLLRLFEKYPKIMQEF